MTADPFALPLDTSTPQGPTVPAPDLPDVKPDAAPKDTAPKRPTTRAERAAVAAANKAKREAKAKDKMPAGKPTPRRPSLENRLAGSLASLGTMVTVAGATTNPGGAVYADGLVIVQHSASVAAALDKVAKDDPRVAAALERMLTAGTWSGLVAALLPVALGIAANHQLIPANIAGMLAAQAPEAAATSEAGGIV